MSDRCAVCDVEVLGAGVVLTSNLKEKVQSGDDLDSGPDVYCSFDCASTADREGKADR